jgi:hypothetical protein
MTATSARVQRLLESARMDAYGPDEQLTGIATMVEDNLHTPFDTRVLGVNVTVDHVTVNGRDELVAICTRGSYAQAISLADLPLPTPPPDGHEWIDAYKWWAENRW